MIRIFPLVFFLAATRSRSLPSFLRLYRRRPPHEVIFILEIEIHTFVDTIFDPSLQPLLLRPAVIKRPFLGGDSTVTQ